jgi:hypothetical protein
VAEWHLSLQGRSSKLFFSAEPSQQVAPCICPALAAKGSVALLAPHEIAPVLPCLTCCGLLQCC